MPVKLLARAKTRLREAIAPAERPRLVLAICLDTIAAANACPGVGRVVVVSSDAAAATAARRLGAMVVPDRPDAGLNPALVHGARHAVRIAPDDGVAALSADLPALRSEELAFALAAAGAHPRAFVADASGTGTTLLTARPGVPLAPAYGPGSRSAHAASGAVPLAGDWPSLRRDVDTVADLADAALLGLGPRTRAVLARTVEQPR